MRRAFLVLALAGCAAPQPPPETPTDRAIARGAAFLVCSQNPDGSWGTGKDTTDFDVMAMVPGSHDAFRVGATALAVMALRECGEREASARGLRYLAAYDGTRRASGMEIYNVWAHTYGLQALARAWKEDRRPEYRRMAERHLEQLGRYETFVGGWNYYDFEIGARTPSMEPTSFGTSAALAALHEARQAGIEVPEGLVRRALARLKEMRKPDGSFLYGSDFRWKPLHLANRDKGSLGRTQAGHHALSLWGEGGIGGKELRAGLETFFREHRFLEIGRKRQYPHEAWYFTSGYYYYFGHYAAALLVEGRPEFRGRLADCILPHQEADGSWWDYKMWDYHKAYGTAFAVMALRRCRT